MASPCDNRLTVNIKKLPIINDINKGDFLIVETADGTNIMDFRNFLITLDNTTFGSTFLDYGTKINAISASLTLSANDLGTITTTNTTDISLLNAQVEVLSAISDTIVNGFPNTADLRISLNASSSDPTIETLESPGSGPMTLYVHKYRGDKVSLYDKTLKRWRTHTLPDSPIPQELVTANNADLTGDSNYDVYLSLNGENDLEVSFVLWVNSTAGSGPTNRAYVDGVCVHASDYGKRLIGCIRTTNAGESEQTIGGSDQGGKPINQFVWNAQNRIPVTFTCWESTSYEITGDQDWRRVGGNDNFRFSFIAGDTQPVDIIGQIYALSGHEVSTGFVINSEALTTPNIPEATIGSEVFTPHGSLSASASTTTQLKKTFTPGYHFCQQVEKYRLGGLYTTATVNNSQLHRTGFIVSTQL